MCLEVLKKKQMNSLVEATDSPGKPLLGTTLVHTDTVQEPYWAVPLHSFYCVRYSMVI